MNTESDKLITLDHGTQVWICDYVEVTPLPPTPQQPNETTDLRCVISGNTNLKNGYDRTYTVTFLDKNGKVIDWQKVNYQWNVVADFEVEQTIVYNKITIKVKNEDLIGSSFLLGVSIGNSAISDIKINIIE